MSMSLFKLVYSMKTSQVQVDWATQYFNWLKEKTKTKEINGWTEITTPFLDRHNDGIVIYIRRNNDKILISDDGYTLADLEACGYPIKSESRKQILLSYLRGFGVTLSDKELIIEANDTNFPQRKHFLLQAILAVNDMFMLTRSQIANIFLDDLTDLLDESDVRYTPNVHFQGISGLSYRFDFVIPKSRKRPERIITAINSPNITSEKIAVFNWNDTQKARTQDSLFYVFINDNKKVSSNVFDILAAYNTTTILWSERKKYISDLAS